MLYEGFSLQARKAMALANQEAHNFQQHQIRPEHILIAVLKEGHGVGVAVLRNLGVDPLQLCSELRQISENGVHMGFRGKLPETLETTHVLEHAAAEARSLNLPYLGTESLLLGLMSVPHTIAATALTERGLSLTEIRQVIIEMIASGMTSAEPAQFL